MKAISGPVAACILSMALLTVACDDMSANLTVPGSLQSTAVMAEPLSIAPQFVTDPFCVGTPPFLALVNLTVSSTSDLFLQTVRFDLADRFGARAVPTVSPIPIPGAPSAISTLTPIPMPGTLSVPIPGQVSFSGQPVVSGQPRTDSFSLRFDCGVVAAGTLSIFVESVNRQGILAVSRTSVRVGG